MSAPAEAGAVFHGPVIFMFRYQEINDTLALLSQLLALEQRLEPDAVTQWIVDGA